MQVATPRPEIPDDVINAAGVFTAAATDVEHDDDQAVVFARILAALVNEATWAAHDGVATEADIDTAVRYGVNYPRGLFEWSRTIGSQPLASLLAALDAWSDDDRFVPPPSTS